MREAFHKMFWGFLFVLLEIHIIVVDILPDPIGYILIILGLAWFRESYNEAKKAHQFAIVLTVLSIPSVFISQQAVNQIGTFGSASGTYGFIMQALNLILVFMVFQLLLKVADQAGENELVRGTTILFKMYMTVMILALILPIFTVGVVNPVFTSLVVVITLLALVLEIVYLVWLRKFSKLGG
ncbi:hypothetical protein GCM10011351_28740 [Paraliobacillus quinghaiensis]|uniref:Uncharacterized protein n=1 Tax=Paraliobacillus quinghaiensis TaxID=470815 RepID=A0A917TW04_9BACI|nr:hypothetical protein [Paraliobacillus quinghaiensis]GGM40784.1 hypothetical protein GCM10011351_28740 [Paraliobacillus quinghaiensis]